jgi:anti-sigma regulatory factor (Ser/Thr protein kinase)
MAAARQRSRPDVLKGAPTKRHLCEETFQRDDREIARARQMVSTALRAWGLYAEVVDVELLVSELVSNALVHGDGPIDVRLSCDGQWIRLEVADEGQRSSPRIRDTSHRGGWGLRFVDRLADSWGIEVADGTRVWTRIRRSHPDLEAGHAGLR